MTKPSLFIRLRLLQIRICARLLELLGLSSAGCALIVRLRRNVSGNGILRWIVGYRRTFSTFQEAQDCAARFIQAGHEHPDEIAFHSSIADTLRESDYPVLFHLAPLVGGFRKVFDLGGNVGNLFYAYQKELSFPPDVMWCVFDLPVKKSAAEALARQRKEGRVYFSDSLAEASGSDLFIASGSLHYFEQPLDQMLLSLRELPRHVIINRTACLRGADQNEALAHDDLITVQDNETYLVPCIVHGVHLIAAMCEIGYSLRASWPVHERRLWIPLFPDLSSRHYFGFYFQRNG